MRRNCFKQLKRLCCWGLAAVFVCSALTGCADGESGDLEAQIEELKKENEKILNKKNDGKGELAEEGTKAASSAEGLPSVPYSPVEALEVIKEYSYEGSDKTYHIMIVKNTGEKTVDLSSESIAYDKENNILGASYGEVKAVGAGCTSILYEYYTGISGISYYKTNFSKTEDDYYKSVLEYLKSDISVSEDKVLVTCKNTGSETAEYVEAKVLFFDDNGKLVYFDERYLTDDNHEIKPDFAISQYISCKVPFSSAEVYLTGRRS